MLEQLHVEALRRPHLRQVLLAELLEEDNRQVTSETRELIQFIEGMSGESLDSYLQ